MKHQCNFIEDGKLYIVRCEKCDQENYTMAVASGVCCWCAYDGNEFLINNKDLSQ